MDEILNYLIAEGHITQEEFDKKVEEAKAASLPNQMFDDIGAALAVSLMNNDQLAVLVLDLMKRVEALENA